MSTAAFIPQSYDTWAVGTVRIVVHSLGPVKPGAHISYNHWTISLLVAQDEQKLHSLGPQKSVRLDMQPEGPQNGQLIISLLNFLVTRNATQYFDFQINSGCNVHDCSLFRKLQKTQRSLFDLYDSDDQLRQAHRLMR